MTKYKTLSIIIASMICITACGSVAQQEYKYTKSRFSLDDGSVHKSTFYSNEVATYIQNNEADVVNNDTTQDNMAEVSINSIELEDTSDTYVESGNDIIYLTKTFKDLNKAENDINHPYTKEQFINFIVKTSNRVFEADTINTTYNSDEDQYDYGENSEEYENTAVTLDDELTGNATYEKLKAEYGEPATWNLSLSTDKQFLQFVGSSKYIMLRGTSDDINIDMSEYQNSGIPTVVLDDGTKIAGNDYIKSINEQQALDSAIDNFDETSETTEQPEISDEPTSAEPEQQEETADAQ